MNPMIPALAAVVCVGFPPARAPVGVRAHEVESSHMMASDTEPTGSAVPAQATVTTKAYKIKHPQYGPGVFRFPVVQAASPAATRAINRTLKKVRENIYDAEDDPSSLIAMTFAVNHNGDNVLSLSLEVDSMGAYPTRWSEHHSFLLSTGEELTVQKIFEPAKMRALASRVDIELQKEIGRAKRGELPGKDPECKKMAISGTVGVKALQSFQIKADGIVFSYDYMIPHAGQACQPDGQFLLPFADLAPYLRLNGPLSELIEGSRAHSPE